VSLAAAGPSATTARGGEQISLCVRRLAHHAKGTTPPGSANAPDQVNHDGDLPVALRPEHKTAERSTVPGVCLCACTPFARTTSVPLSATSRTWFRRPSLRGSRASAGRRASQLLASTLVEAGRIGRSRPFSAGELGSLAQAAVKIRSSSSFRRRVLAGWRNGQEPFWRC
jgi:hypothetical protein